MEAEFGRTDMISAAVPTFVVAAAAAAALGAWIVLHARRGPADRRVRHALAAVRAAAGAGAVWLVLQTIGRFLLLASNWRLAALAVLAAGAVEAVVAAYGIERRSVSRRTGAALLGLRLALVAALSVLLAQPVLSRAFDRDVRRFVAVLLDDSQSMYFTDRSLTESEKLRLASFYGVEPVRRRPRLDAAAGSLAQLRADLAAEADALRASALAPASVRQDRVSARRASLSAIQKRAVAVLDDQAAQLVRTRSVVAALDPAAAAAVDSIRARMAACAIRTVSFSPPAHARARGGRDPSPDLAALLSAVEGAAADLSNVLNLFPAAETVMDRAWLNGLPGEQRDLVEQAAARSRAAVARDVLARPFDGASLLDRLRSRYQVLLVRFASRPVQTEPDRWLGPAPVPAAPAGRTTNAPPAAAVTTPTSAPPAAASEPSAPDSPSERSFRQSTDLAAALEKVVEEIPSENLAGALVLTDGRHNAEAGVEAVARRMGLQRCPVRSVLIGGAVPPTDAALLDVRAPDSVYLGDKVAVRADVKFDGLRGRKVTVKLLHDGRPVAEEPVSVADDRFRTTLRFAHTPDALGTHRYGLRIEPQEGELSRENNDWDFDVAVSDDRTNVLLADDRPRWEFRYLRNLFYGRDKSVHLQFVLWHPDRLEEPGPPPAKGSARKRAAPLEPRGLVPVPTVPASASRRFGDAEATALPESLEEWMKFDVLILGDLPPGVLNGPTLENIRHCVAERGALLVLIAGPGYMPHAYDDPILREMLPVTYRATQTPCVGGPEPAYRLRLSPDGRNHPILQQSTSHSENAQVWDSLPEMAWRHPILGAKEGATVLAHAEPVRARPADDETLTLEERAGRLAEEAAERSRNALIVAQRYGRGRVLLLAFDGTWRLRYQVGDTYHHRFWGQVLKWGAGENLRAGTDLVRLGTDRLSYSGNDPVHVVAKVLTAHSQPLQDATVYANVYRAEHCVARRRLLHREDSNGIYEAALDPLPEVGEYRVELEGREVAQVLARQGVAKVETSFRVVSSTTPVEMAEMTADAGLVSKVAELSGGSVCGPEDALKNANLFGPGSETLHERRDRPLWDTWLLMLLAASCAAAEWLVRKHGGLA